MELPAVVLFGAVNLALGVALAWLRRAPAASAAPAWAEALLLFFLATAVCDGLAAAGWGLALAPNAYALALGFFAADSLRRRLIATRAGAASGPTG